MFLKQNVELNDYQTARKIIIDSLPRNSIGAEIGVHLGEFSKRIINNVKPQRLHLIDPWVVSESPVHEKTPYYGVNYVTQDALDTRYNKVVNEFEKWIDSGKVVVHREFSNKAALSFPADYFDFVYVDGDHSYQGVLDDLENYSGKLKLNGFLILDDYKDGKWWGTGIIDACHDFLVNHRDFLIHFKTSSQVVLRRFK